MSRKPTAANCVLVLLRRTFDFEPVRLFATRDEALRFIADATASDADPGPNRGHGELGPPGLRSRILNAGVVEFVAGIPKPYEPVRWFDPAPANRPQPPTERPT